MVVEADVAVAGRLEMMAVCTLSYCDGGILLTDCGARDVDAAAVDGAAPFVVVVGDGD